MYLVMEFIWISTQAGVEFSDNFPEILSLWVHQDRQLGAIVIIL